MDFFQYQRWMLNEIHKHLGYQTNKLCALEAQVHQLIEHIGKLQSSPGTNVEKIEYNFEQLKIESLNGTLTIGIPSDKLNVDDLELGNGANEPSQTGDSSGGPSESILETMNQYIIHEVPPLLDKTSRSKSVALKPEQIQTILDDMLKQVGGRIKLYLEHSEEKDDARALEQKVLKRLQEEVALSVDSYIEHFREGSANEGSSPNGSDQ